MGRSPGRARLMEAFAALLDALVYTTSRNRKLALIAAYLRDAPDPDRGWALAALTDGLDFPAVKSSTIRNLMMERIDPVLWALSRDFVGDTAETASLLWPEPEDAEPQPGLSLAEVVERLSALTRASAPKELPALFDRLDSKSRYALIKLATGGMRATRAPTRTSTPSRRAMPSSAPRTCTGGGGHVHGAHRTPFRATPP